MKNFLLRKKMLPLGIKLFWTMWNLIIFTSCQEISNSTAKNVFHQIEVDKWTSCDTFYCNQNIPENENLCKSFTDCQCKNYFDIKCSKNNFSCEFSFTYMEVPRVSATFLGISIERGDFEVIFQFSVNALPASSVKVDSLSFTHYCTNTLKVIVHLKNVPPLTELLELIITHNCIDDIVGSFGNLFPKLVRLDLSQNSLKHISNQMLQTLIHLEVANFTKNDLVDIHPEAFKGLKNLRSLYLAHNNVSVTENNTFGNLRNLEVLNLDNNQIITLSPNIFNYLTRLTQLSINHNRIQSITDGQFRKLTKLKLLDLSYNQLTLVSDDWLKGLSNLVELNLEGNKLQYLKENYASTLNNINIINLNDNHFMHIPTMGTFSSNHPPQIYISNNSVSVMPLPLTAIIRKADILDLSNNCFTRFDILNQSVYDMTGVGWMLFNCRNCCLTKIIPEIVQNIIATGNFSHNQMTSLTMKDMEIFANKQISGIDLSYNNISTIEMDYNLINEAMSKTNLIIFLNHNPIICDCKLTPFLRYMKHNGLFDMINYGKGFQSLPPIIFEAKNLSCASPLPLLNKKVSSLKESDLKCELTIQLGCPEKCHCHMSYEKFLIVNCTNTNLYNFPILNERLFQNADIQLLLADNAITTIPELPNAYWEKISKLDLGNNELTSVANLKQSNRLMSLHLENNLLNRLETPLRSILSANETIKIYISNNRWKCNCDLLSERFLLYKAVDYAKITCITHESKNLLLTQASDKELCPSQFANSNQTLKIIISLTIILTIISIASFVFYQQYKPEIKLWLFTHGLCMKLVSEEDIDADKIYDAFVSYSSKDEEWVISELVRGLESGIPSYSLCLHERDWPGGEWIPNQIARSVQQSRRTIIVLTTNFIDSYWSKLEFQVAYRQMLNDNMKRILIVVPKELPQIDKLDEELKAFISINTYIQWDKPNFWRKMRCAMPRVKTEVERKESNVVI